MRSQTDTTGSAKVDVLGTVATEHILDRLKEAMRLAEEDLLDNLERFRELLEEASDQTDAWVLTRIADGVAESQQAVVRCEHSVLARVGGEPAAEFLLIPFGEVKVERPVAGGSFAFTPKHAESARHWFDQMGRKLAIDYEHQSFERHNTRPDGLRPAAGWIGRLEVRDDGLWACDVTWTDRARELLRSGEYRYFSPVIYWTDEDYGDVAALGPVALTNDPAMRGVQPLAAARRDPVEPQTPENVASRARSGTEGDEDDVEAASALHQELEAAQEEVSLLRRQLAAQEADTFVERGMRLGKILDSTSMDWREDYLRDPEHAEARLARAPVVLPPGRVVKVGARGEILSGQGGALNRELQERWGIEEEDLAAYERALAAGRIKRFGAVPSA